IGIIYASNKAFVEAEQYFRLALEISREQGLKSKEGMNLINLGITLDSQENEPEAVLFLNEASGIFKILNDSTNLGAIENSLGNIFYKKGEYTMALEYYRQALRLMPGRGPVWFSAEYAT